jgi:D-sedoheptulose 7-phosphate isomerase
MRHGDAEKGGKHDDRCRFAAAYLHRVSRCIEALSVDEVARVIDRLDEAHRAGRRVFMIGNGGSAATASHLAVDLGKTILSEPATDRRFRIMSLTDNVPWITAIANDIGYDQTFAEQLRNLMDPGDVLVAISGSGNSPNVLRAIETARAAGGVVLAFLGQGGGHARELVDDYVLVPSDAYAVIEDVHCVIGHLLTSFFASALSSERAAASGEAVVPLGEAGARA